MKTTTKRFLSILLSVFMLFGTVALAIPAMVVTASADDYTNIPANTAVTVNGVKIRYDRYSGNNDGYVHVYDNGTIEIKIRHGDMVWFPDVVMTDSSTVHGEVTPIGTNGVSSTGLGLHTGFAYNVQTSGDGSYASANIVGYNNGGRVRIAGDTKAKLGDDNGSDGYGSGGTSKRPVNGDITNSKNGIENRYVLIRNSNNEVGAGKTAGVNLKKTDGKVYVEWLADYYGAYHTANYTDSTDNIAYLYAGGSVGYGVLYQSYDNYYATRRIENLYVTNCEVAGVATDKVVLAWNYTDIPANSTVNVNGVNIRYDRYSGNDDGYVHAYPSGKIELKIRHGDMVWFPDLVMTDNSLVHGEVTVISGTAQHSGFAYSVAKSGDTWASAMIAGYNNGARVRIAGDTKAKLGNNNGSDGYGSGGTSQKPVNGAIQNLNSYYDKVKNGSNEVAAGKTVGIELQKKSDGKVYVDWLAVGYGAYHSANYNDNTGTVPYLYAGGSVGYSLLYQGYNDNDKGATADHSEYIVRMIENLYVTNCTVAGNSEVIANLVGEGDIMKAGTALETHTNVTINGQVWRFDPTAGHTGSCWAKLPDGTILAKMEAGDLLWMPEVAGVLGSIEMDVKLYSSDNGANTSQMAGGIAYNIDAGENGTWGDSTDTAYGTNVQTEWRRRIGYGTYTNYAANNGFSGGTIGTVSGMNIVSDNRDSANYWYNSTGIWAAGRSVHFGLFRDDAQVTATFGSTSNPRHTTDYYTIDNENKKPVVGPFGFQFVWTSGANVVQISNVTYETLGAAMNLSLDGKIKVNFGYYSDPAQTLELVARNGETVLARTNCDPTRRTILSIPVNAKEMTDTITITIEEGGSAITNGTYSVTVKQYAEALAAADAEWADLMNAMLDYGAAAQELFGYNTSNLASDISSGITFDVAGLPDLTTDGDRSFLSAIAGTLTLESGTDLNLYFKAVDPEANLEVSAVDQNSEAVALETETVDGYLKVSIKDLAAEELGDEFYITVSDGTNSVTFTYSALCWVKSAVNSASASDETKTLAKAVGVYASEAQKKNNYSVISLAGQIAGAGAVSALRSATDSRISSIRSSANDNNLIWTGSGVRNYYVSSSTGSDSNSGTDESHPWKTLGKVNEVLYSANGSSTYKYNIYLKRGDTWRGEYLKTYKTSNVTITTYGSGAKPVITGSPENGANASKWTNMGNNIWRYAGSDSWEDVGNIVFNDGESYGRKVVQVHVQNTGLTDFTHPTAGVQSVRFSSYTDLKNDLDFYHDKDFSGGSGASGYLYLYSTSNPGSRFSSIEFSVKQNGIEIYKADNVRVDNVCVKYVGGHGIAGQGLNMQNILIQNCEFGWIGGSISDRIKNSVIGTETVAYDLRYGNAVEIYGGCNNFRVQNNYIYQVYDAGITQQYSCGGNTDSDHTANQLNIYYHNNVIENCNYSIEYFISNCPTGNSSYINNFQITDNIMWNAGKGLCETRGIWERGFSAHVKSQSGSTSCNRFANSENAFVISGNQFIGQRDAVFAICSKMSASNANANPVVTNNEFYGIYQTNKIGAIANYNSGSDVSIHNVYAPYDTNIQTYMNGAIGASKFSGNTIKFLINF